MIDVPAADASRSRLRARQSASQRAFYRALGGGEPASSCVDLEGDVQATIVPVRPHYSIFNAVVYRDADALRRALPGLGEVYLAAGSRCWSIWVPPGDAASADLLREEGYVEEGSPLVMAATLAALDLGGEDRVEVDRSPTWTEVARCNDAAHGVLAQWSMAPAVAAMDDPHARLYATRVDGAAASVLLARHRDGDCYFWFVATLPEQQGRGLARALMRRALADAAAEGCTTASLESTHAGERLYRSLGFTELGRCGRWARYAAGPDAQA